MWNDRIDELLAGIKITERNINSLRYTDDTTLMAENEEELKSLLMNVKGESEKAGLKFNIQKTKIRASGPITSWEIDGENVESVRFNFLGLQNQCGWWPQPWNLKIVAPWKNSYVRPRSCFKKQKHHFVNKGPHSQSYGFSSSHVWMWEMDHKENWAPKNWWFFTVVLEKTLKSLLECKEIKPVNPKGNQSWLSLEGLMLKLNFGHQMRRADSLEKTLMLGKIEGQRRREWQRTRWLEGITDQCTWIWTSSGRWWRTGMPGMLQSMVLQSQTCLSNWTTKFVIGFLPKNKYPNFMATVMVCSDFGAQKIKIYHWFHILPLLFDMKWWHQRDLLLPKQKERNFEILNSKQ